MPVIESCECQSSCYLAPLKEQHLEIFTDENGQTQQRWKVLYHMLTHCIHVYIVYMYTLYTCIHCIHVYIVYMYTLYTCIHCIHVYIVYMYTLYTCIHCIHVYIVYMYTLYCIHCIHVYIVTLQTINVGQCKGYCEPSDDGRICIFP